MVLTTSALLTSLCCCRHTVAKKVKKELFHKDYSLANLFLWAALEPGYWPYWIDFKEIQGCCIVSKDCLSSTIAVEPHTSPLSERHFSLHFLPCIYGQLSFMVPFKREGNKSFLFSAKVWACLAMVRSKEASNDWDRKSKCTFWNK